MTDVLYQIIEGRFDVQVIRTSLETATDVTYSVEDLRIMYPDAVERKKWPCEDNGIAYICTMEQFIFVTELATYVRAKLREGAKEVTVDFVHPDGCQEAFEQGLNTKLKEFGIMYRPSKQVFVKYIPAKPKAKKKKEGLNGSLKRSLLSEVYSHLEQLAVHLLGVNVTPKSKTEPEDIKNFVRLLKREGIDVSHVLQERTFYRWDRGQRVGISQPFVEYILQQNRSFANDTVRNSSNIKELMYDFIRTWHLSMLE